MKPFSLPPLRQVRAERLRRSFALFVQQAWPHVDPAPLVWNWHLDALCIHLQAVTDGEINRLLINIPPGHAKSMIVSVLWPAWVWARDPKWSAIFGSYELGLVMRDAVRSRTLMDSEWYSSLFRNPADLIPNAEKEPDPEKRAKLMEHNARIWTWQEDQNAKKFYKNSAGGGRQGVSVGAGTGYRAESLIVDDPLSADQANSEVERESANRWFFETMSTRFNDLATARRVVIMQRLHEQDLTGAILAREGAAWCHLNLPSEFESKRRSITRTNTGAELWRDPRTEEKELLFPAKFSRETLAALKTSLGSYAYSGQHQQEPIPASGGLLKAEWFSRRWTPDVRAPAPGVTYKTLPQTFDRLLFVTDATFKKTSDSDFVAIGVFLLKRPDLFLIDLKWDRLSFTDTLQAIRDLRSKWPRVSEIAIEDKANGSAIIDVLKKEIPGVVPFEPFGGKEARIAAAAPMIEAGNVWLPASAPWVDGVITEAIKFPKAAHDDAIDMLSSAIIRTLVGGSLHALEALARR